MSRRSCRLPAAMLAVAGLAACAGENPVRPGAPLLVPTSAPPTAAPAPAAATPTPAPAEPPPAAPGNRPISVSLTGGGSCHPTVSGPCTVEFQADVKARGNAFDLLWSGCASGTGPTGRCTVTRPGAHTATVTVTDRQGATARASATATGVNQPPVVRIGGPRPPDPAPANRFFPMIGDEPYDPDDWPPYMNLACPTSRVTGSGACRAQLAWCGGVGNAFDIDITTTGPGTCVVEATVTDPWGAVARDSFSFRVLAP